MWHLRSFSDKRLQAFILFCPDHVLETSTNTPTTFQQRFRSSENRERVRFSWCSQNDRQQCSETFLQHFFFTWKMSSCFFVRLDGDSNNISKHFFNLFGSRHVCWTFYKVEMFWKVLERTSRFPLNLSTPLVFSRCENFVELRSAETALLACHLTTVWRLTGVWVIRISYSLLKYCYHGYECPSQRKRSNGAWTVRVPRACLFIFELFQGQTGIASLT